MSENLPDRLALPAPTPDPTQKLNVDGPSVKLDDLGPMIVNSDGTLSRIANWANMTVPEQERTIRVLAARNKLRLANEKNQNKGDGREEPLSIAQEGPPSVDST